MNKLPNHTALKEWASVIAALGLGEQVVLLRKGGIADPTFGVEANRFYLYPTNFHEGVDDTQSWLSISHWCEVIRTWQVRDLDALLRLESQVVLDRANIETRFRFRSDQAVNVIAVRTFALAKPVTIAARPEYEGCRSWISIEEEIDIDGSRPALSAAELAARIESVDALLAAAV
jgi:hypothetical protein